MRLWIIGIATAIVVGSGYYLYKKHTGMVEEIARLEMQAVQYQETLALQQHEMKLLQEDVKKFQVTVKTLQDEKDSAKKEQDRLEKKLTKNGRDIGFMATKHPDWMEKISNKGVKDRNRCLEVAMGSPVLESEKGLSKSERNNVCPNLFGYTD